MRALNLAIDCVDGDRLLPVDEAFDLITASAAAIEGEERVALDAAVGRVTATDVATAIPLPPFDHSAVDGYGLTWPDLERVPPHRLRLAGRIAAGGQVRESVGAGEAVRIYTGAPVPPSVAAVVPEERCRAEGGSIIVSVPVPAGANIRRKGEDVGEGSAIVEGGTILDGRHIAIVASAGYAAVAVRPRVRVAVVSTGDELRRAGTKLDVGAIYDFNRPMLAALLTRPWTDLVASDHVGDSVEALSSTLQWVAKTADFIVTSGGAAGSETDHTARAIVVAGGAAAPLRVALRPGKPVVHGRIGETLILGLPGNPVAAMVNLLLFGRALLFARAGLRVARPRGQPAVAAGAMAHARGRTEFAPARIVGHAPDGRPLIEKIGRGGSARLRPLVLADGFAEISSDTGEVEPGAAVAFHAFHAAFAP